MVETLINLKNNKLKQQDARGAIGDSKERILKFVNSVGKRHHGESAPRLFLTATGCDRTSSKARAVTIYFARLA